LKRYINLAAILFWLCHVCCFAQTVDTSKKDTASVSEVLLITTDTLTRESPPNGIEQQFREKFKPDSKKATIFAAIFPGLGQIYNRKYWKLPLVYCSFIGCAYAITWNGNQYNGYRNAYLDFINDRPGVNSWDDYRYGAYLKQPPEDWDNNMKQSFANTLKSAKDYYRRYRDLSYIVTVGVYAIWIIDAYVDAQLFNFDISPDLSMRVEPVIIDRAPSNSHSVGMQLSFAF